MPLLYCLWLFWMECQYALVTYIFTSTMTLHNFTTLRESKSSAESMLTGRQLAVLGGHPAKRYGVLNAMPCLLMFLAMTTLPSSLQPACTTIQVSSTLRRRYIAHFSQFLCQCSIYWRKAGQAQNIGPYDRDARRLILNNMLDLYSS